MYRADAAAARAGIASLDLMEAAGRAVADTVAARWGKRPLIVLCGPGNNGGDGFVVARLLAEAGWPVRVALPGGRDRLKGDARANAERWTETLEPLSVDVLDGAEIVVDALFGAGLGRPVTGVALDTLEAVGARGLACVAVDIPSGVHGDTGAVLGGAARADVTVTFFRRKPGHLLYPGRGLCGEVITADIGIPDNVLDEIAPRQAENSPALWLGRFPWPLADQHKYSRGHAVIAGGAEMTGAARLAAEAARRAGAGIVTVLCPPEAVELYRGALTGALVAVAGDSRAFADRVGEARVAAILLGPGNGVTADTRECVLAALATGKPVLLDADALSVFAEAPGDLFGAIRGPCLMTPHEGEFTRLFGNGEGGKLVRTRDAAVASGAVIVLKGADSVIAAPDGRAVINANAPPTLATAGSGDVLAGFAVALLARGMDPFDAGCCASWLHGAAAAAFGPGLIAEDLAATLPQVFRELGG
jgi:NAD(P)H-hydrate epimerase